MQFGQVWATYQHLADRVADVVLIVLAVFFTAQHLWGMANLAEFHPETVPFTR